MELLRACYRGNYNYGWSGRNTSYKVLPPLEDIHLRDMYHYFPAVYFSQGFQKVYQKIRRV